MTSQLKRLLACVRTMTETASDADRQVWLHNRDWLSQALTEFVNTEDSKEAPKSVSFEVVKKAADRLVGRTYNVVDPDEYVRELTRELNREIQEDV